MLLKGLVDEDFVNYKLPSMFIICPSCNFKCDKMHGKNVCQNSALATSPNIEISVKSLVDRYLNNSISKSIVFGGLEPFDSIEDVINFSPVIIAEPKVKQIIYLKIILCNCIFRMK